MSKLSGFVLAILLIPALALAQAPAPSFEVASIKVAEPITQASILSGKLHVGMQVDGARVDIGFMSLNDLITMAYKIKPHQLAGPDWLSSQRFDILAKLPDGAKQDEVPDMIKALLEERFGLKVHRENREMPVYALVVAKGGPKVKEAAPDVVPPADAPPPPPAALSLGTPQGQVQVNPSANGATITGPNGAKMRMTMSPQAGQMRMEFSKVSMPEFVELLTRFVDRPVVDQTEMKGNYEAALDLTMADMLAVARAQNIGIPLPANIPGLPGGAASDPGSSSVFQSVQQLGLRLESKKLPAEFVVVDKVEKMPTEN